MSSKKRSFIFKAKLEERKVILPHSNNSYMNFPLSSDCGKHISIIHKSIDSTALESRK